MADYTHLVARARARYPEGGLTPEQAVRICHTVASLLKEETSDPNWGVHRKGGNSWAGYATDIVANRGTVTLYDILGNVEGEGRPQWGIVPGALDWAPVDVALVDRDAAPNPDPKPEPNPEPNPNPPVPVSVMEVLQQIAAQQLLILQMLQAQTDAIRAATEQVTKVARDGLKVRI